MGRTEDKMAAERKRNIAGSKIVNEHRRATAAVSPLKSYGKWPSQKLDKTQRECSFPLLLTSGNARPWELWTGHSMYS